MCFFTTQYQKPKIAKEDIHCWKTGFQEKGKFISEHLEFEYKTRVLQPRVTIRKENTTPFNNGYIINEGYHSFSDVEKANIFKSPYEKIREFIIPKGTRYFYNKEDREYVSETIMMLKNEKKKEVPLYL